MISMKKRSDPPKEDTRSILKLEDACFTCENKLAVKGVGWACAHPASPLYQTKVKLIQDRCDYHTPKLRL